MSSRQIQFCILNDPAPSVIRPLPAQTGSNLLDVVSGVDGVNNPSTGASQAGAPVILNPSGKIDSSLFGQGTTAQAGENIAAGNLVNLYSSGSLLLMQKAYAAATGTAPSGGNYPVAAQGFVTTAVSTGNTATVSFVGLFIYSDPNSEFSAGDLGVEVYLSDVTPGGVTKTRPSGGGELVQSVGYVVTFAAPNQVTIQFLAGFQDFSRISGVVQISQGGTGATTNTAAVTNLFGTKSANTVFAGPVTGSAANPTFRGLVAADLTGAVFGASGGSHSVGAVPDPGASAGITRFLREDSTWAVPAGGATDQTVRQVYSSNPLASGGFSRAITVNFGTPFADGLYTAEVSVEIAEVLSTAPVEISGFKKQTTPGNGITVWVTNFDSIAHNVTVHVFARHD